MGEGTTEYLRDPGPDLGFEPGEFPRKISIAELTERIHPEDVARVAQAVQRSFATGAKYEAEYRLRRKDGSYIWVESHATAVGFVDGKSAAWLGAARVITERKRTEEDLRRALSELREIKSQLEAENIVLREEFVRAHESGEIVGKSAALKRVLQQAEQVSAANSPVLITGETGTGKELVARAIHQRSSRRELPLVVVNCGALPTTLVESELFGHEKGAFTGATSARVGRFELAHRGTIFLDEVGELPLDLQVKLLRVLQTGEFERLGSSESRRVDVRLIAATNRDLEKEVKTGGFRRDLFYRLNVFPIHVPPLRERAEDVPLLVAYLAEKKANALGKRISRIPREDVEKLARYDWPGNVRELENVIERALILSAGPVLTFDGVPNATPAWDRAEQAESPDGGALRSLKEMERAHILKVCEACRWTIRGPGGAAARLGLHPSTLYFRMKKLSIQRPR